MTHDHAGGGELGGHAHGLVLVTVMQPVRLRNWPGREPDTAALVIAEEPRALAARARE